MEKSSQSDAHSQEAEAGQVHQGLNCQHFKDGVCCIAQSLVRIKSDPRPSPEACEACTRDKTPREVNSVTASLAISYLHENEPDQVKRHLEDLRPHLTRILKPSHIEAYALSTAKWAGHGFPTRSKERQLEILTICRSCEYHREEPNHLEWCGDCMCTLGLGSAIFNKIARETDHCPRNKW